MATRVSGRLPRKLLSIDTSPAASSLDRWLDRLPLLSRHTVSRKPNSTSSAPPRSEEHTSELQSLMRISYAVFCFNKTKIIKYSTDTHINLSSVNHNHQ